MTKFLIYSVTFWLAATYSLCQEKTGFIKVWQEQNPTVFFVSLERFNLMTPEERERLENEEVIFFTDIIRIEDIEQYEINQEKTEIHSHYTQEEVKKWTSIHPEVKIVKHSIYSSSPESIQEEYRECSYCLILKGEYLTLSDIRNYETEKQ